MRLFLQQNNNSYLSGILESDLFSFSKRFISSKTVERLVFSGEDNLISLADIRNSTLFSLAESSSQIVSIGSIRSVFLFSRSGSVGLDFVGRGSAESLAGISNFFNVFYYEK